MHATAALFEDELQINSNMCTLQDVQVLHYPFSFRQHHTLN